MKEEMLTDLIHKKITGQLSDEEVQLLDTLLENKDNQIEAEEIEAAWDTSLVYLDDYQPNVEGRLTQLKSKMQQEETTTTKVVPIKRSRRTWLSVAAAVAILAIGSWFIFNSNNDWQHVAVTDTIKNLNLVDGSKVAVNTNSRFSYPNQFENNQRLVKLNGEAFFDIAKDASKPFIIESGEVQIEVLGTSFNVRNYDDENTVQITVRSGKVRVTSKNGAFNEVLEANDQLTYSKTKRKIIALGKDENLNALSWWNGKLAFVNERIERVAKAIEHTFNVEFEFENTEVLKCGYTISGDVKSLGLDAVLESMKLGLAFDEIKKIGKNKYRFIGGQCSKKSE